MEDPVEIRVRIDRVLERVARRDDYGTLLARGDVVRRLDDVGNPDAWRSSLRRQARGDRLRIRSGTGSNAVWAFLLDGDTDHRRAEGERYGDVLNDILPMAVHHRHEPSVLVRDGDEVILRCDRCPALAYAEGSTGLHGGSLIEEACPHDDEPQLTSLSFSRSGRPSGS